MAFYNVTSGAATLAADINQYASVLNGSVAGTITLLGASNAATPLGVVLPSAPVAETSPIWTQVNGDTTNRVALYIRTDGYGGMKAGVGGAASTATFYATASGWKTDQTLTVASTLSVLGATSLAGLSTSGGATIGGNLQANNNLTVNGSLSLDAGNITSDGSGHLSAVTFMGVLSDNPGAAGIVAHDLTTLVEIKPQGGSNRGIQFDYRDSGGVLHAGLVLDNTGGLKDGAGNVLWTAGNDGSGSGLDADLLDGHDTSFFLAASAYTAADVLTKIKTVDGSGSGLDADTLDGHDTSFFLAATAYTAADVLAKIKTVDGSGSGLDADTLDGHDTSFFATAGNYLNLSPTAGAEQIINGPIAIAQNNRFWVNVIGSVQAADGGTHGHIGFVDNNSNKLAQFGAIPGHGAGDMAIAGSTYWTTVASAGFNNSATFSGFDVAEVYATDQPYEDGTVLCPQDGAGGMLMRRCVHDGCHAAMVVSKTPGFAIGGAAFAAFSEEEEQEQAEGTGTTPLAGEPHELLALVGRVRVRASGEIAGRQLVATDGQGGVRAMRSGEQGWALGYALHAAQNGMVGIVVRPLYCQAG